MKVIRTTMIATLLLVGLIMMTMVACGNKGDDTDVSAGLKNLTENQALPLAFIEFAGENIKNASKEEAFIMVNAIYEAQQSYVAQLNTAYESANANEDFSNIYTGDINKELVNELTDVEMKRLVTNTYDQGFTLEKSEGYVYAIIDLALYEEKYFPSLTSEDVQLIKDEVNAFNESL